MPPRSRRTPIVMPPAAQAAPANAATATTSRRAVLFGSVAAIGGLIQPARAATSLRVAYIPILAMAQLFVIVGEGWAAAAGLDLQLTRFSSGPAMVQALPSGGYDVAYIGIGPAMVARSSGVALVAVANNGIGQSSLIGLGAFATLFKTAASPAEAFTAFHRQNGRPVRIATLPKGSVPDTVLQYYLRQVAHVPEESVQVLGVGEDRMQQMLLSGAADAASALEPILTIVQERVPDARILVNGSQMFPNQPGAVLAVSEAAIRANRAAVQTLVALHVRATQLIASDPARAAKSASALIGQGLVAEATLAKAFMAQGIVPNADPHSIIEATQRLAEFQISLGTLARAVPVAQLFDTSFFDALPAPQR